MLSFGDSDKGCKERKSNMTENYVLGYCYLSVKVISYAWAKLIILSHTYCTSILKSNKGIQADHKILIITKLSKRSPAANIFIYLWFLVKN
jgi:hypothetical protein